MCKIFFKKLLFVILIFSFASFIFSDDAKSPDKNEVQNIAEKIRKSELARAQRINMRDSFIYNIYDKITYALMNKWKLISIIVKYLIIVIVIAVLLIIAYYITRFVHLRKYKENDLSILKFEHKDAVFDQKVFDDLIESGKLSEAVVYLHRCTIFYLLKNNILFSKNLTNYLIYSRIKDSGLKDAFKKICDVSERILFDDYTANTGDLERCRDLFYKNFTGLSA